MAARTIAVQIEGLSKDVKYMREKIDDGFKTTHEKQDKTNGRLLKLEDNEKLLLPKAEFQKYLDENKREEVGIKKERIVSKREITIAFIGAGAGVLSILASLKLGGVL